MQKNIYIEHEPIYINTPYGKIYIESIKNSKELAVTVFDVDSKVKLCFAISDKDNCICEPCGDLQTKICSKK